MTELQIIDYIVARLDEINDGVELHSLTALIAELETSRRAISSVPSYCVTEIVNAIFNGGNKNAE